MEAFDLPQMVINELSRLPEDSKNEFFEEYKRKKKSIAVAYILWLMLGWHYAYTGKWGFQILFWVTAGGLGLWWFVDLFRVPGIITDFNKDKAVATLKDLKIITNPPSNQSIKKSLF